MNSARHVLVGWMLAALLGCAGSRPEITVPVSASAAIREEFNPHTLNDDDFLLKPTARSAQGILLETVPAPSPASDVQQVQGYRVQIAAVLDRNRAESLRARVQGQLQALAYTLYDQDTHLYKIQVGNSKTPERAERLRTAAKQNGYQEAYVVRTSIEITPTRKPQRVASVFRIQILAAPSRQSADQAQARARQRLGINDIFVDFEPPYFKVRIGNFKTRKEAESFLETVKKQGYETPFIVEAQTRLSPR
ncbi:MAG: SPOR domain-containing protein [bacterium]|nr:SPOR domain-containing protein [bacterium]